MCSRTFPTPVHTLVFVRNWRSFPLIILLWCGYSPLIEVAKRDAYTKDDYDRHHEDADHVAWQTQRDINKKTTVNTSKRYESHAQKHLTKIHTTYQVCQGPSSVLVLFALAGWLPSPAARRRPLPERARTWPAESSLWREWFLSGRRVRPLLAQQNLVLETQWNKTSVKQHSTSKIISHFNI